MIHENPNPKVQKSSPLISWGWLEDKIAFPNFGALCNFFKGKLPSGELT